MRVTVNRTATYVAEEYVVVEFPDETPAGRVKELVESGLNEGSIVVDVDQGSLKYLGSSYQFWVGELDLDLDYCELDYSD